MERGRRKGRKKSKRERERESLRDIKSKRLQETERGREMSCQGNRGITKFGKGWDAAEERCGF